MSRMSRRAFLGFRFSEEDAGTRDVPGGVPPETPLPPEFSPAMLRAEAERLGLDPDRIEPGNLPRRLCAPCMPALRKGQGGPDKGAPQGRGASHASEEDNDVRTATDSLS